MAGPYPRRCQTGNPDPVVTSYGVETGMRSDGLAVTSGSWSVHAFRDANSDQAICVTAWRPTTVLPEPGSVWPDEQEAPPRRWSSNSPR
jgi:hypothetical protein